MNKRKFILQPETGTLSEEDAKRYFSTVGLAVAALVVLFQGANFALSWLIYRVNPALLDNVWVSNLLSFIPLYCVAFPVFYLILRRLPRDRVTPEKLGAKNTLGGLCVAVVLMMVGSYVANILVMLFESVTGRTLVNPVESATAGNAWWINLIFMAILAPILEELVFRKVLCDRLLPLGEGYAVLLSGAVFGLTHGNFYQFFYAFLLGALFALIYVKTGRIRYSVFYHALINLVGGVFMSWVMEKVEPLMETETLNALMEALMAYDTATVLEIAGPALIPLMLLSLYESLLMVASVFGVIFMIKARRRLRLAEGLLPPPKEGRVAMLFCNVGVAAALTVYAALFILSLL